MKIYSTYFGNSKNIPDYWVQISVAWYPPRYFTGKRFLMLAPDKHTLKWEWSKLKAVYLEKLQGLDPLETLKALEELSGGKDVIIIGYEKDPAGDTRGLIKDWLKESMDIELIEIENYNINDSDFCQMTMEF